MMMVMEASLSHYHENGGGGLERMKESVAGW